jgi:hypothetical protein
MRRLQDTITDIQATGLKQLSATNSTPVRPSNPPRRDTAFIRAGTTDIDHDPKVDAKDGQFRVNFTTNRIVKFPPSFSAMQAYLEERTRLPFRKL